MFQSLFSKLSLLYIGKITTSKHANSALKSVLSSKRKTIYLNTVSEHITCAVVCNVPPKK